MKASEFDKKFDDNKEDILQYLDLSKIKKHSPAHKRVNVDFPPWMVQGLDKEAGRVGVTRQALIKMWLAEKLDTGHFTS